MHWLIEDENVIFIIMFLLLLLTGVIVVYGESYDRDIEEIKEKMKGIEEKQEKLREIIKDIWDNFW